MGVRNLHTHLFYIHTSIGKQYTAGHGQGFLHTPPQTIYHFHALPLSAISSALHVDTEKQSMLISALNRYELASHQWLIYVHVLACVTCKHTCKRALRIFFQELCPSEDIRSFLALMTSHHNGFRCDRT